MPLLERADAGNHSLNGICVSGRSRELLLEPLTEFLREKVPANEAILAVLRMFGAAVGA